MKQIEVALRNEIAALEDQAQPLRDSIAKASKVVAPLEERLAKLREAMQLVLEAGA